MTRSHLAPLLLLIPLLTTSPAAAQFAVGTGAIAEVWANNCANCHGAKGQGGGAGTSSLLDDEYLVGGSDLELFTSTKAGIPDSGMPAFGETMPSNQIWALTVYIRELQHRDRRERLGSPKPDAEGVYTSKHHRFRTEPIVTSGLTVPWSLAFLPDGRMLIADRPGDLRVHSTGKAGGTLSDPVANTPKVDSRGQGGLMEVALHPEFATNGWVYLAYSDALPARSGERGRPPNMTKIVRGHITPGEKGAHTWTDEQVVFQADPAHYIGSTLHFGCRIAFEAPKDTSDPRHTLYFSIGERGRGEDAQNLTIPNGKVHRIYDDGTIPADNPFNTPEHKAKDALASIWSYGHRNPQGLVFDTDGNLWDTEHGPRGGDELNLIERGRNYGWPLVTFGMNYNGAPLKTPWPPQPDPDNIAMPTDYWLPSIAACGLDVVRGEGDGAFRNWTGDLLAGGLSGMNVDRIRTRRAGAGAPVVTEREELLHGLGRVRDVCTAPDGTIYVVLNDPHHIIRLVPVDEAAN